MEHMFLGRAGKACLLLAAMCAVLAVSMSAASPAHRHSDTIGGDCNLCCAGHLPVIQSPLSSDMRPTLVMDWRLPADEDHLSLDPQFAAPLGRAPPR